jgi:hypothetical protein
MIIRGYSICGYWCLLMVIILGGIDNYSINGYCWIFYCAYFWLLMIIILMAIGEYSIGGY